MWQVIGIGVGVALAFGVAGRGAQHWAARVLCAVLAVVLAVVLVVAALFGGKASPAWAALDGALAFAVVAGWLALARLYEAARADWRGVASRAAFLLAGVALVGSAKWYAAEQAAVIKAEPAAVVKAEPAAESCPCGTGAICEGPRGGRYCIADGGGKRYLAAGER